MKHKNFIALVLAASMAFAMLTGCGQEKTKSTESAGTSKATEESAETAGSTETTEEPTVLTVALQGVQKEPISLFETEVFQKIQEMANVKIEYIDVDNDAISLMFASEEFPDIFLVPEKFMDTAVEAGHVLDMWPLLEEYAPNMLLDTYTQRNELIRTLKGGDEQGLYFLAPRIGVENRAGGTALPRGYNVRWDYYLEIGAPEIKNDDDYIEVLEQMVAAHPETENGEKVYAMGVPANMSYWTMRAAYVKPTMANNVTRSASHYMASFEDGHLINGYTDIESGAYWVDMKFYNKLYNKGLLDPDSFTQTTDQFSAKNKAGRYVGSVYRETDMYNAMREDNPDTLAGFVVVPSENALVFADKKVLTGYFPSCALSISADSENWEAALRFFNVLHDPDVIRMIWCGFEGEHWNYVDGVPTFTDEMVTNIDQWNDELKRIGARVARAEFIMLEKSVLHPDGYPVDLLDTDAMRISSLSPLDKNVAEHYGVQYPSQAATALVEAGKAVDLRNDCAQLVQNAMEATPTDISRIIQKCNDILYTGVPKLVMAATEEEYEKAQAEVLAALADAGEADAWAWYSEQYNSAREIIYPIFKTAK